MQQWHRTHFLAPNTNCAFRSLKLASRISGVSSHLAFPPASIGVAVAVPSASECKRSCKPSREIRFDFVDADKEVAGGP